MPHPDNPFQPQPHGDELLKAFVVREEAYTWIHQTFVDSQNPHAATVIGASQVGKTTLLRHFSTVFDPRVIGVYVPMPAGANEQIVLTAIAEQIAQVMGSAAVTDGTSTPRSAFADAFLPRTLGRLRPQQRLVLLLDDAHHLMQAGDSTFFTYLSDLILRFAQLSVVLTVDHRDEAAALVAMRPLVAETHVYRLKPFTFPETQNLLSQCPEVFQIGSDGAAAVQALAGGQPLLVQSFATLIYDRASRSQAGLVVIHADDIMSQAADLVNRVNDFLMAMWNRFDASQQIVLVAVCEMSPQPTQAAVVPERIEAWLVETESPLDLTMIRAALRGLEYESVIRYERGGALLVMGIWQVWLINRPAVADAATVEQTTTRVQGWAIATGIVVVLILTVILILQIAQRGSQSAPAHPSGNPTVTLEQIPPSP